MSQLLHIPKIKKNIEINFKLQIFSYVTFSLLEHNNLILKTGTTFLTAYLFESFFKN